jgi:hypothetical protein
MGGSEFAQMLGYVRWWNVGRCSARDERGGGRLWNVVIWIVSGGSHRVGLRVFTDNFMGFPV